MKVFSESLYKILGEAFGCYSTPLIKIYDSFKSSDNNIYLGSDYKESLNSKQKWKWKSLCKNK